MRNSYIFSLIDNSIRKLYNIEAQIQLDKPKNPEFGDIATNIAFQLTKSLKKPPMILADEILKSLEYDTELISNVNVANPGFINFKLTPKYYQIELKFIIEKGSNFGESDSGNGKSINVEYVSANPTGLLHLGHGRNAVIGDTVANLYKWIGYTVTREYYFNNAGNQMNNLGKSIHARYIQLKDENYPFPEDGYHGEYVKEIAGLLFEKYNEQLEESNEENLAVCRKFGEEWCFKAILATLEKLNIKQDIFFNEDTLYKDGKIEEVINEFRQKGLAYDKDGAIWLKLSEMGLTDDRVIVKSTGEPTYRLPDIAYHREKLNRGYDLIVDIFGADHIATVPDVIAGIKALGYNADKVKVLIHQFITLTEGGQQVKMSKRTGKSYTLDDLLEEVGSDVVRFFLIMRSINTHLEFDLALAREQSEKNPVYYLQYAHARICSIIEKAKENGINIDDIIPDLSQLTAVEEINLIKEIIKFPETIESSALKYEPQVLAEYLREVASAFHIFYHNCRIIGSEENLRDARLKLVEMAAITLRNGLRILGISTPERM